MDESNKTKLCSNIGVLEDITYKTVGGEEIKLDIYPPLIKKYDLSPVVVFVHGGGWRELDKARIKVVHITDIFDRLRRDGYIAISINYRLSDEHIKFPIHLEDCKDAVKWIRKNHIKYGIDKDRIGLLGASAGAHLALMIALTDEDMFPGSEELSGYSSKVNYVVSYFGPTDLKNMNTIGGKSAVVELMGGEFEDIPEQYEMASPINYLNKNAPPILLVHGTADTTVPVLQSQSLYQKANKTGMDISIIIVENLGHGQKFFNVANPALDKVKETVIGFIKGNYDQKLNIGEIYFP